MKTMIVLFVILCLFAFISSVIQNGQINKLNDRIEKVYEVNDYNNDTINSKISLLETRFWKLENPPKYSVGDKVGDYVVIKVKTCSLCWDRLSWTYYIVDINTGKSYWCENLEVDSITGKPTLYWDGGTAATLLHLVPAGE
jgi:hypothetical protein